MNIPASYNSCEQAKSYFKFYTIPQVALLWCGVPADKVDEELKLAVPVGDSNALQRSVLKHPYISCLETYCRVIHEVIDNDLLPVGRDGSKVFLHKEIGPVAVIDAL